MNHRNLCNHWFCLIMNFKLFTLSLPWCYLFDKTLKTISGGSRFLRKGAYCSAKISWKLLTGFDQWSFWIGYFTKGACCYSGGFTLSQTLWGRQPQRGTKLLFGQNLPKTAWKCRRLGRGGVSKILLCRSATVLETRVSSLWFQQF